jgi:hypothetical protein
MTIYQKIMTDYDFIMQAMESCKGRKAIHMDAINNLMDSFHRKHSRKRISIEYDDLIIEMMIRLTEKFRTI